MARRLMFFFFIKAKKTFQNRFVEIYLENIEQNHKSEKSTIIEGYIYLIYLYIYVYIKCLTVEKKKCFNVLFPLYNISILEFSTVTLPQSLQKI